MLDVELLRIFLAVTDEGSIHAGARKLLMAQPAVSRSLQKLEREMGAQLLVRSHRGVEVTPAGSELVAQSRDVVAWMERVPDLVQRAAKRSRVITVGVIAGAVAASALTEEIFAAYAERVPGVELVVRELTFIDQFSRVEQESVDIALVRPPYRGEQLVIEPLFGEPVLLVCRADNPVTRFTSLDIDGILELPMVEMIGVTDYWNDFWLLTQQRGGAPRTHRRPVSTVAELRFSVMMTGGVIPVSRGALGHIAADPLTAVPLDGAPLSVAAVATRRGESRPEVLEFSECARRVTRKHLNRIEGGVLLG